MANEATVTTALKFTKGSVDLNLTDSASTFDVTGTRYQRAVQSVGTAAEALDMGDITDPGWAYFRNLDASNYVELFAATGETAFLRLNAGEHACVRLSTSATAPFAQADTASIDLEYMIVQT